MPTSGGLRVAVVTVSDRAAAGTRADATGPALVTAVEQAGLVVHDTRVIVDGVESVSAAVCDLSHDHDVVLLAGGTGLGPRDRTPEAVQATCDPMVPGMGEAIRAASRAGVPTADLSRACAGVRGRCLVLALPGSPDGATDAWDAVSPVVPHAVAVIAGTDHS